MENTDYKAQRLTMVDCQVRPSDVTKFPVISAMLAIPREEFVPENLRSLAYLGDHLPLGNGRCLLDPRVFSKMLDEVDIRPDEFVLDIGCGLGYSSTVIARIAEAVVALEEDSDMAAAAAVNLDRHAVENSVSAQGALCEGAPLHAPYDVIVLQGGVEFVPGGICAQLKEGGRIACIFVDQTPGECRIGIKTAGQISWRSAFNADAPLMAGYQLEKEFVL